MTGDEKYQGYLVDLLKILSKQLKFRYSIHLVEDGRYGGLTDGNWSGMIGEVNLISTFIITFKQQLLFSNISRNFNTFY